MDDRTIQDLERRLQKLEREAVRFRKGQVTATAPLQAKIGASDEVQTANTVSGTNMTENDSVAALANSSDLLVLGKIVEEPTGVSLTSTTEWAEQSNLTAQGTRSASNDNRGWSVAITSSGLYAVVGAPNADSSSTVANSGYVFLFSRSGTTWSLSQSFSSSTTANDNHGASVAISDAGLVVAGGAPGDASNRGAVIVRRYSTSWSTTTLTDSGGAAGDNLGFSVALSSTGATLIAGAPNDTVGANSDQGSAVVWTYSGSSWSQQAKLTKTAGTAGDTLGRSVALSADGNTALVGAPFTDISTKTNAGSATVFTRSGTTWSEQANLTDSASAAEDLFGSSVALSNDGNTAVVGSPGDDVGSNASQGSAIVYTRSGSTWTEQTKLTYSGGAAGDFFGYSVSINGAGTRIVVGQQNDDIGINVDRGSLVVFDYSGSVWDETTTLEASTGVGGDKFGYSTAISDDGYYAMGGAPYDDVSTFTDHGSATVFALTTTTAAGVTVGDGTVTEAKLANNSVTSAKIVDGTIATGDIANDAITSAKIAADAVGSSEIAADAVGTSEIAADAVTSSEIATDAVGSAEIAADAVTASEIAAGAVGSSELADGSVTSAKIGDGEIVNADISASAGIVLSKLATDPLARANHTGTQTASTVSDFDTQVRTSRLDQMAAPTSSVSLNSQKITSLLNPTSAQDAATKDYVDDEIAGVTAGGVSYGTPGAIQPDDTASDGVANTAARSDHRHSVAAASAGTISGSNAEGTSTSFARADHDHALGTGAVSRAALAADAKVPTGAITAYGGSSAPSGFLICDGAEVAIATYGDLYAIVSTSFGALTNGSGGAGSSHFRLPNLKGRVVVGRDSSDVDWDTLGETRGAKTVTLAEAELPPHTHGAGTYKANSGVATATQSGSGVNRINAALTGETRDVTGASGSTGSGNAHNNIQPSIVLNYIIKT